MSERDEPVEAEAASGPEAETVVRDPGGTPISGPDPAGPAEPAAEPEPLPSPAPPAKRPKRLRKTKITLIVLAALLLVVAGGGTWYVHHTIDASFPQVSGTLHVPGLDGKVEVDRNAQGVPQIYADSSHDLFFAQGYVQAQDRFWQMDVYRHITAGRLAELFGSGQVKTDEFIRTMGWYRIAQQEYDLLSPSTQASLIAYSAGVNAYLHDHTGSKAGVEYAILGLQTSYKPYAWTPVDSIAWLKALAWDLRDNLQDEIDRSLSTQTLGVARIDQLFPAYPSSHPDIVGQGAVARGVFDQNAVPSPSSAYSPVLPAGAVGPMSHLSTLISDLPQTLAPTVQGIGSNSWVVSGALTTTGRPLLANDPHLGPELPSIWYQMGLHCTTVDAACPYDVAGFTMPGTPGVVIGHTSTVAWGFTNGTEDVTDLVLEKVTGDTYLYDGRQLPLTEHKETIGVAGGSPVTITVRQTNQGPLVSDADTDLTAVGRDAPVAASASGGAGAARGSGYAVALRWTALTPGRTMDALFEVDRATDWTGFRAAAEDFVVPSQNMIFADAAGDIGYQTPGEIPIRKAGDGTWPVPGWTSAYSWTGYIPFDRLPHELNPKAGFIVTANNPIISPSRYPYLLSKDFDYGYRADEITARLTAATSNGGKISADGMRAIEADTTNEFAEVLVPYLESAPTTSATAAAAKALLRGWDFTTPADSAATAYFCEVYYYLLKDAFMSKLPSTVDVDGGDRWFAVVSDLLPDATSDWWSDPAAPAVHGRDALLGRAMDQAAQYLSRKYGADPAKWQWGDLHTLTPTNQTLGTGGPGIVKWLLNGDPIPVAGGSAVVDANGFDIAQGFAVDEVPSMRMVVDLSDLDHSTWINLTGASGHVDDPNYLDQLPLWQNQKTLPWPFSHAAVLAATKNTLMLMP